jgi:hypothetical protein
MDEYFVSWCPPLLPSTVWPITLTVAVSEAAWPRDRICFQTIQIRNKNNPLKTIEAVVVDFVLL